MNIKRKTKIVCTLGPSTDNDAVLKQLMLEGMNVARMNFSHGTHEEQKVRLDKLKALRNELKLPVAALLDTKGPEIRLKLIENDKTELKAGQELILGIGDFLGNNEKVAITYDELYKDVKAGDRILIDDGLIEMVVESIQDTDIHCRVQNGGMISNRKGVNVPNVDLSMEYISQKDYDDIVFAVEQDYDFIAASFVRTAQDVLDIRKILEDHNCNSINIISKIENMQGVQNIDDIIRVSDGIMVARGDMGVEIPLEEVPIIQKKIIQKVYNAGKQVITATQMLDSMMKNPRPTRAEATDVANAVYDGTSAIMLSGETAAGSYPIEAVKTMVKIAERAELDINYANQLRIREILVNPDITNAIAHATCMTAMDLNASAIITVSKSGLTARNISKYRPDCQIIGCCVSEKICRQLNMSWGVTPILVDVKDNSDELFEHAVDRACETGLVKDGEIVVLTAGLPLGISGTTNMIKVHVAGHILLSGKGIGKTVAKGSLCVANTTESFKATFKSGDIVVMEDTNNEIIEQLRHASGIIIEKDSDNAHGVIAGMTLGIPVIKGARNATTILKSGAFVKIDPEKGTVSCN